MLKRNSCGTPRKCSVSKQTLDTLTHYDEQIADQNLNDNEDENQKTRITFQWHNITRQYKTRPQELSTVNLYQYCSMHWHKNQVRPVQFYGYYNKPTWPLNESFSKWTLTLYKPWHKDIGELKAIDGTFKTSLE